MKKSLKQLKLSSTCTSCSAGVEKSINSCGCGGILSKYGFTKQGNQRFICKKCNVSQVLNPKTNGYGNSYNQKIILYTKEGLGIRSIGRILKIAPSTVLRKILVISNTILNPIIPLNLERVQVDELHTFIGNKSKGVYIIYSFSQEVGKVLSMTVGSRSKVNLRSVVSPLLEADVTKINTDGYSGYKGVVPMRIHTTFKRRNNGIERNNLTIRTHLKRLNRRTIAFSKSLSVLVAILKIYFWL